MSHNIYLITFERLNFNFVNNPNPLVFSFIEKVIKLIVQDINLLSPQSSHKIEKLLFKLKANMMKWVGLTFSFDIFSPLTADDVSRLLKDNVTMYDADWNEIASIRCGVRQLMKTICWQTTR